MSFDKYLDAVNRLNFAKDEILLLAIVLNNYEFIKKLVDIYDFESKEKHYKYDKIETNLLSFMEYFEMGITITKGVEYKIYYPSNRSTITFCKDTYGYSYLKYIGELILDINNIHVMKLFLEKDLLHSCQYALCNDRLEKFDVFYDLCMKTSQTIDKNYCCIALDILYRGMLSVCTNGLDSITEILGRSKYSEQILSALGTYFDYIGYGYGIDSMKKYHPKIYKKSPKLNKNKLNYEILNKCLVMNVNQISVK